MMRYEREALPLARAAVADLGLGEGGKGITHLIVASCTGFFAPGLDLQLIYPAGLPPTVERTVVGFMGCYAAMPALKLARQIVRSAPSARVLVVALELCTLHLQESRKLDELLSFLIFGDGCAAVLVSAEPSGIEINDFAYVGLELVEDGIANLCLLVQSTANRRFGRGWPDLHDFLASATSALCDRLDGASPLWKTPFSVVCPLAGHIHDHPSRGEPAVYRVGDRFAYIPPFSGDGLAIALRSAALATAHIQDRGSVVGYLREARRTMTPTVRLASAMSRIATTSLGRTVVGGTAAHMPWLLRAMAGWTRLPEAR